MSESSGGSSSEQREAQAGTDLAGLRVVALESRMSDQTAVMLERAGATAVRAPSMRELPLENNETALQFARALIDGELDAVIFLTGVGAKHLAEAIETRYSADEWRSALAKVQVIARGPKPLTVLRGWKVRVDVQVPEPNTWRDLLETLDRTYDVRGKRVAIQEYGQTNPELVDGLTSRGAASIMRVPVYRWALPEDLEPLKAAIRACVEGTIGAIVITSAQQIRHLFQVAQAESLDEALTVALRERIIVASVGPVATEALGEYGLKADVEPEHPKLGPLIKALAAEWRNVGKSIPESAFGDRK
jgi:uroporphyrinogen-III synthase